MARQLEQIIVSMVTQILKARLDRTPEWLMRPGKEDCGDKWHIINNIYYDLTHMELPLTMPLRERRKVDAVFMCGDKCHFIFEFDEKQHFNRFRAKTLRHYQHIIPLAFNPDVWIRRSEEKKSLEGGGFAKPRPPLFPEPGGRHLQRAFRDSLCDIVPGCHGFAPTLRIAYFEVQPWLHKSDALNKLSKIVEARVIL